MRGVYERESLVTVIKIGSELHLSAFWNALPSDLHQRLFFDSPICGAASCQTDGKVPLYSGTDSLTSVGELHAILWNDPQIPILRRPIGLR
jgi:hypothetical protein